MTLKITSIRQHNKTSVLKYIINNQPISRATVSNETGLNKATVSEITKELLDEKIVQETGIGESTLQGGRKPIMLTFNHRAGMSIGIDIGVNSIRIMSTYLNGEIITQEKMNYKTNELFSTIKHILKTEYSKSKKLPYGVVGATISVQGIVHKNKIFFTPNYNIVDIEAIIKDFDFPIFFENEANLAAYAHLYNSENQLNDHTIAAITLRTGIGSGIITNGEIYKGFESRAGELGHTVVVPNGTQCPCGNKGCLEMYASEKALLKEYNERQGKKDLTIQDFIKDYRNNETVAKEVLEGISEFLAIGLNNFIALFAIEEIYLVSNLSHEIPSLVDFIDHKINSVFSRDNRLLNSDFGKFAPALGAALYSTDKFIDTI